MRGKQIRSLGEEDTLEKEMATQSRVLAWRIPLKRSLEGPQSAGLQKSQDTAEQTNKKEGRRGQVFSDQGSHGSLSLGLSIDSRFFLCVQKAPVSETLTSAPL